MTASTCSAPRIFSADAEVVIVVGSRPVAAKEISPNHIVMAVDEAVAAARCGRCEDGRTLNQQSKRRFKDRK